MDVQELTPKRLSDPDDFAADDFVTLSRLDDYVHWAADELEQFARHPAFDYEPGRDFHLTRLEDMISEAAEMIFDDRYPNPPVWVLLKAIRDHIERLKRYWDDPDDDGSKVSLHGHGMAIDEARVWARLPWNAQADDMHTALRPNVAKAVRSRPRERRSRRLRTRAGSRGDPSGSESEPDPVARRHRAHWSLVRVNGARLTGLQAYDDALARLLEGAEQNLSPRGFAVLVDIHSRRVRMLRRQLAFWLRRARERAPVHRRVARG